MFYENLFERIGLQKKAIESFWRIHNRYSEKNFAAAIETAFQEYLSGDEAFGKYISKLSGDTGISSEELNLYIYFRLSEKTLAEYRRKGIDGNIFYATMKDYRVACDVCYKSNGICGISQDFYRIWTRLHLDMKIFQLGRLQFELAASEVDFEEKNLKLSVGQPCIGVHIPAEGALDDSECEAAYESARIFFKKHYGIDQCVFTCNSWLMHPWLSECLSAHYGVVRFQKHYFTVKAWDDFETFSYWVFPDCKGKDISEYPADTSLRRAALERVKAGLPVGKAIGVRL